MMGNMTIRIDQDFKEKLSRFSRNKVFSNMSDFIRHTLYEIVGFVPSVQSDIVGKELENEKKMSVQDTQTNADNWDELL
jgi:Arc/MetJ-type ribon-helix-helix transcriptional regulator